MGTGGASAQAALAGANVLVNLSGSPITVAAPTTVSWLVPLSLPALQRRLRVRRRR